jgi:hypothetical protein
MTSEPVDVATSLQLLDRISMRHYSPDELVELRSYWARSLSVDNPVTDFVERQGFAISKGEEEAHLIASVDRRIPELGFIGFFESDSLDVSNLLAMAEGWLRERRAIKIVAPFDMSILHGYRFNNAAGRLFRGEPLTVPTYPGQFEMAGYETLNSYVSAIREDFETILPATAPKKGSEDFSVREINIKDFEIELLLLHTLSLAAFAGTSEYFVDYSLAEFLYWYSPLKDFINPRYVEFLYHKSTPVGFAYSFVQDQRLIMKSIGVVPAYHGAGLSKYLIYSQHRKAQEDGLESVIYALIRLGNNVTKMPYPGVKQIRSYRTLVRI